MAKLKDTTLSTPKKKNGRPLLYKEDYVRQARIACEELGATDKKLAKLFGVSVDSIHDWKIRYPEFKQAIIEGKDVFNTATAETCNLKRITGYDYKEVVSEPDPLAQGKMKVVKITKKHIPSDPTSTIFFLKNRDPRRWRDAVSSDVRLTGGVNVSPEITEKLTEIYNAGKTDAGE